MRPLSAIEAISPAIQRTRDLLGRPFRLSTFFKIAAVGFFAQMGAGGLNFNVPGHNSGVHTLPPAFLAFIVAFAVVLAIVGLIVGLIFFYLGSRLQLVLVELIATRQKIVGPVWGRFGSTVWRWLGLRILFLILAVFVFAVIAVPLALALGVSFIHGFHHPAFSFATIALLILAVMLYLLAFVVAHMLLQDFVLPSLALEDLRIGDALFRLRLLLSQEPGEVALFLFLQLLLSFVAAIAAEILLVFALLLLLIPFAIVGVILYFALHGAGAAGTAVLIGCGVLGGLVYIALAIFLGISALGPVYLFSAAYALYFLGGRYPLLGDLLDRSTPPPAQFYPPAYPPAFPPPESTLPPAPAV